MGMIKEPRRYNQTADTLKGLLIVLVILGHFLLGTLMDNPIRYFIYSFHMPLFLFVGGIFNQSSQTGRYELEGYIREVFQAYVNGLGNSMGYIYSLGLLS